MGVDAAKAPSTTDKEQLIARGQYLTQHVAMCVQCHSPHDNQGNLIPGQLFTGQDLRVKFMWNWDMTWAQRAPNIVGLPGYTHDMAIRLLTKGIARTDKPPRRPMPPFRLSREDAEAVIAYLKSPFHEIDEK